MNWTKANLSLLHLTDIGLIKNGDITLALKKMATKPSNLIIDELKQVNWKSILEVGCGTGAILSEIKKEFPDRIIKGIDCEADWHNIERNPYKGHVQYAKNQGLDAEIGDGRSIAFDDKSFDIVFCQAVLVMTDVNDFKKIIKEMIRVAKDVVIMIERHNEEAPKGGQYYDNDPPRLMANFRFLEDDGYSILFNKIPSEIWGGDWGKDGYIIKINLKKNEK